jgi:hypothetical protein
MAHFVEWDSLDVRIDGDKLNAMVKSMIGGMPPVETIAVRFTNGLMRVEGTLRKFITIPFAVDVTEIRASGTTMRVPLRNVSAAGFPIPMILFGLIKNRLPKDLVSYEEPATLVMSLDRFLPNFVSADIQTIWIIDGGLAVTVGRGGADLPIPMGGSDDSSKRNNTESSA